MFTDSFIIVYQNEIERVREKNQRHEKKYYTRDEYLFFVKEKQKPKQTLLVACTALEESRSVAPIEKKSFHLKLYNFVNLQNRDRHGDLLLLSVRNFMFLFFRSLLGAAARLRHLALAHYALVFYYILTLHRKFSGKKRSTCISP